VVVELTGRKLKRAVNRLAFEGVMLETIFYFYFYFLSHNNSVSLPTFEPLIVKKIKK